MFKINVVYTLHLFQGMLNNIFGFQYIHEQFHFYVSTYISFSGNQLGEAKGKIFHVQSAAFNLQKQPLQEWFVHYDTFVCMTSFQTQITGKSWEEKTLLPPFEQKLEPL